MRAPLLLAALLLAAACREKRDLPAAPDAPRAAAKPPKRTAVEDTDLRVMLAQLASAKACEMIRGQFRPLRDPKRPGVATGILWINGCRITQSGTRVTFRLAGDGWQWADQSTKKAGGTFTVQDHVRFRVQARIPGSLDLSYDRRTHVASVWFTPSHPPEVEFEPLGEIDVDRESVWASIIGEVGSVFGKSPESMAASQADQQGTSEFEKQLGEGLSVTIDLCTGYQRFGLGRPGNGKMVPPDVGESRQVPAELHAGAPMLFGPYLANEGFTAPLRARGGAVRAQLYCHDDAEAIAKAYAEGGEPPAAKPLATRMVRGRATLAVKRARCPVVLVARSLDGAALLAWKRPVAEAAVGPLVHCEK